MLGIGLLLLFPFMIQRRTAARRDFCEFRQANLAKAVLQYDDVRGRFPGFRNLQAVDRKGVRRAASWVFAALPYLETDEKESLGPYTQLEERYGRHGPDETRGEPPREYVAALVCPENPPPDAARRPGWLAYIANCGLPDAVPQGDFPPDWPANGVFLDRFRPPLRDWYPFEVTLDYVNEHDDAACTLLLSENVDCGGWTEVKEARIGFVWSPGSTGPSGRPAPRILQINRQRGQGDGSLRFARPASYHPGGVIAAYASGATSFINESIDPVVFARAMSPDDAGLTWPGTDQTIGPPYRRIDKVAPPVVQD
jgi:hypothetical protein